MIGALIGGATTLLGGLFGRKKKQEKTTTESVVDYQKMVSNATAAGFNPLTAIRNGGSAGFSTTTTTAPGTSALPGALASLGGILGEAFDKQADPVAKKARQPDTALVDYQLRKRAEVPRAVGTLYPGGTFEGTKVTRTKPSMSAARKLAPYLEEGQLTNTDPLKWSNGYLEANPNRVDAAQYEDAYGELIGSAAGVVPLIQDGWHNAKRLYNHYYAKQDRFGGGWIRTRPLNKAEKKAVDESWLPSWVPRFSFK